MDIENLYKVMLLYLSKEEDCFNAGCSLCFGSERIADRYDSIVDHDGAEEERIGDAAGVQYATVCGGIGS